MNEQSLSEHLMECEQCAVARSHDLLNPDHSIRIPFCDEYMRIMNNILAYEAGMRARHKHVTIGSCPYPGSPLEIEWRAGWSDADMTIMHERGI